MPDTDRAFVGAIPDLYERRLGPMLFEPYALDLARRFEDVQGELLETAAGTGRLTRALAEAAPQAAITATDLNAPMLAKAAERVHAPGVRFRPADAQALPFADGAFDAVVCQFGVMFFPDKTAAFAEARRVLKPQGQFAFSVWDALGRNEIAQVVHETLAARFPDDPPAFFARMPYGWHDPGEISETLRRAGFRDAAFDVVALPTASPSAAEAAEGLCLGTPLRPEIEARAPDDLASVVQTVADALRARFGAGAITGASQALVVTARP